MRSAHTVDQVRAAEGELMARLPEGVLMQRAAAGLAYAVIDLLGGAYGRRVLLLVGSGNNGGDALYAGVLLARRGCLVDAWLLSDRAHEAGVAALRAAGGRVVRFDVRRGAPSTARPDVVVDGIVGIGGRGGLDNEAVAALAAVPGVPVVAVDVPSVVGVDTGELDGEHVRADVTVTFGTHKIAHLVDPAAAACGVVQLVDIGLDLPSDSVTLPPGKHGSAQAPVLAEPTGPCADQDISVSPEAKDPVAGRDVEIVLHLRTIEAEACTWEVSPKTLTMKITSGADDIWSTRQCPRAVPDQEVVVRRETSTSLKMTWPDAKRSDDQCSRQAGWAMPGYYHVEVAALAGEPAEEQFKLEAPTGQVITRSPSPHQSPHQTPSGRPVVSSSSSPSSSPSSTVD